MVACLIFSWIGGESCGLFELAVAWSPLFRGCPGGMGSSSKEAKPHYKRRNRTCKQFLPRFPNRLQVGLLMLSVSPCPSHPSICRMGGSSNGKRESYQVEA